jgi:ABC-type uncharacterized transport system substrate-binding protein
LQTASHPALNTISNVVASNLKQKYNIDIDIVLKNGEGVLMNIESIANQFICDDSYDMYLAIGTPALQSLARLEKKRPVLFGAVTDTTLLGLDLQENISGFLDQLDYNEIILNLLKLFPNKIIGILYSLGDISSQYCINELINSSLLIKTFGCVGESELIPTLEVACQSSDVLFIPTDNIMASAIKIIIDVAKKYKKNIFMTDTLLLSIGGDYAQGVDYNKQGEEIAFLIKEILEKKNSPVHLIVKSKSTGLLHH